MTDVTVIGIGQMGRELARLLVASGRTVTVWNRTRERGEALVAQGAVLAPTPADAIAASPVVITCLADATALRAVFEDEGAPAALHGRVVVDLGTAGPDEVRSTKVWLDQQGCHLIDGAIQAAPSQMGADDTPVLLAGSAEVLDRVRPTLRVLAGKLIYLGTAIDGAAYMDLATLSYVYGSYAGFLQGARIAERMNLDVAAFGGIVETISPSFGAFFAHQGKVIRSGDFTVSESPLRISISAVERIRRVSEELHVDAALPTLIHHWLVDADAAGYAEEELAALIKVLRRRGERPTEVAA